uniref:Uncharacterized protein n=1 Tax=Timema monikensis TaxID=170555 RepID=A0A7R9E7V8_9NEOP|nr:unnamed protein product [Timema monikensis]
MLVPITRKRGGIVHTSQSATQNMALRHYAVTSQIFLVADWMSIVAMQLFTTLRPLLEHLVSAIIKNKYLQAPIPKAQYGGRHTVTMLPGAGIGPELMNYVKEVFRQPECAITGHDECDDSATKDDVELIELFRNFGGNWLMYMQGCLWVTCSDTGLADHLVQTGGTPGLGSQPLTNWPLSEEPLCYLPSTAAWLCPLGEKRASHWHMRT